MMIAFRKENEQLRYHLQKEEFDSCQSYPLINVSGSLPQQPRT